MHFPRIAEAYLLCPQSNLYFERDLNSKRDLTTVYSPESEIRKPFRLVLSILYSLPSAHHLGYRLFLRNLKGAYRQSLLGLFWTLIPPLVTSVIWIFLNSQRVIKVDVEGISYPIFVITGTILWQTFSESVNGPLKGVVSGKSMLVKINFNREALILSGFYEVVYNAIIKIVLLVGIYLLMGQEITINFFLGLLGFISLMILGVAIGILLTPIALLYNDIQKGLALILQFAIYLTPVIYPQPTEGTAAQLMRFNPVAPILVGTRDLLTNSLFMEVGPMLTISAISLFSLLIGLFIFRLAIPVIIERIGS